MFQQKICAKPLEIFLGHALGTKQIVERHEKTTTFKQLILLNTYAKIETIAKQT